MEYFSHRQHIHLSFCHAGRALDLPQVQSNENKSIQERLISELEADIPDRLRQNIFYCVHHPVC